MKLKIESIFLRFIIPFVVLLLVSGCKSESTEDPGNSPESEGIITVTKAQFKEAGMEIGNAEYRKFESILSVNGIVSAPPDGIAHVSSPIAGIVESINFKRGDHVKKGHILFYVKSNEVIRLQQEFSETNTSMTKLKADLERTRKLNFENINAGKDLLEAETEFNMSFEKFKSLKFQLAALNMDANRILNGHFYHKIPVTSPIDGFVSDQNLVLGQYAEMQNKLVEIIDINKLQLHLSVFESDVENIKIGQKLRFFTVGDKTNYKSAVLKSIGKSVDFENKSILCIAAISSQDKPDIKFNSSVNAQIVLDSKDYKSLPLGSIFKTGEDYYTFTLSKTDADNFYFKVTDVKTGKSSNEYIEIIEPSDIDSVLIKGGFNLRTD